MASALKGTATVGSVVGKIAALRRRPNVDQTDFMRALSVCWCAAAELSLHSPTTDAEGQRLSELKDKLGIDTDEANAGLRRLVQAAVLRDLERGLLPSRCNVAGTLPINLQKGEQIVWASNGVQYFEAQSRREWVGQSAGVSLRVAKGVYLRSGGSHGMPIETTSLVPLGTGFFALTDRHLYYAGDAKSFRVSYQKIVSIKPYEDGVAIVRDASGAKPQIFITGDGDFIFKAATALAQR
jgi:hypothetical protein